MESEANVRRMLIEALRPSLLEFVREEITRIDELRSAFAEDTPPVSRPLEANRERAGEMIGAVDDPWSSVAGSIQQRLERIEGELSSIRRELEAKNHHLEQLVDRLVNIIERVEHRLTSASLGLRQELLKLLAPEPDSDAKAGRLERRFS